MSNVVKYYHCCNPSTEFEKVQGVKSRNLSGYSIEHLPIQQSKENFHLRSVKQQLKSCRITSWFSERFLLFSNKCSIFSSTEFSSNSRENSPVNISIDYWKQKRERHPSLLRHLSIMDIEESPEWLKCRLGEGGIHTINAWGAVSWLSKFC